MRSGNTGPVTPEELDYWRAEATHGSTSLDLSDEDVVRLIDDVKRLRHASRTRLDYNLRCQDCGAPHWLDTSIPSDVWNKIAPDASTLCVLCIDARLVKVGLTAQAEFYFAGNALRSRMYEVSHGDVEEIRRGICIGQVWEIGKRPAPVARFRVANIDLRAFPPLVQLDYTADPSCQLSLTFEGLALNGRRVSP